MAQSTKATMTTPIDFAALTPEQQQAAHWYAMDEHHRSPGVWEDSVIDALVNRGILVQLDRPCGGGLTVYEYEMPIAAHMAWCDWCSEILDEDGDNDPD